MQEICVPIPHFGEHQVAEVEVTVNGKKEKFDFRVESFPWGIGGNEPETDHSRELITSQIEQLRENIEGYNSDWEIVQIYNPNEKANYIQVLFRKKK